MIHSWQRPAGKRGAQYQALLRHENRGSGEVRVESSAQSSKAEPRHYSCPVPESAGKSPPFSHGDIVSALSSHPGGQVGQYLSGLFWKLGNAEYQPPEKRSWCRSVENSNIIYIDPGAPQVGYLPSLKSPSEWVRTLVEPDMVALH